MNKSRAVDWLRRTQATGTSDTTPAASLSGSRCQKETRDTVGYDWTDWFRTEDGGLCRHRRGDEGTDWLVYYANMFHRPIHSNDSKFSLDSLKLLSNYDIQQLTRAQLQICKVHQCEDHMRAKILIQFANCRLFTKVPLVRINSLIYYHYSRHFDRLLFAVTGPKQNTCNITARTAKFKYIHRASNSEA